MTVNDGSDVSTPLVEAAVQLHELFLAWLEAGFTEQQACRIVGHMLAESNGQKPGD